MWKYFHFVYKVPNTKFIAKDWSWLVDISRKLLVLSDNCAQLFVTILCQKYMKSAKIEMNYESIIHFCLRTCFYLIYLLVGMRR